MRKLKLQMQISLDGYVAGPNGEQDWMTFGFDDKSSKRINELTDSSDTILLGRKMTDEFIKYWTSVAENPENERNDFARKMVEIPKIVFSKTVTESNWKNTTVANGDLTEEIEKLKNREGKDIIVYGGAEFVSNLIKNNLIDEYHLFINPVAIGKGRTIFGDSETRFNLEFVNSDSYSSGKVEICYKPRKI